MALAYAKAVIRMILCSVLDGSQDAKNDDGDGGKSSEGPPIRRPSPHFSH